MLQLQSAARKTRGVKRSVITTLSYTTAKRLKPIEEKQDTIISNQEVIQKSMNEFKGDVTKISEKICNNAVRIDAHAAMTNGFAHTQAVQNEKISHQMYMIESLQQHMTAQSKIIYSTRRCIGAILNKVDPDYTSFANTEFTKLGKLFDALETLTLVHKSNSPTVQ